MLVQTVKKKLDPKATLRIFRMLIFRRLMKILSIDLHKISKYSYLKIHWKAQYFSNFLKKSVYSTNSLMYQSTNIFIFIVYIHFHSPVIKMPKWHFCNSRKKDPMAKFSFFTVHGITGTFLWRQVFILLFGHLLCLAPMH